MYYGNRKWRKDFKMYERDGLAFWDSTPDAYKGLQREIVLMYCKSSSIETFRKAEEKINKKR